MPDSHLRRVQFLPVAIRLERVSLCRTKFLVGMPRRLANLELPEVVFCGVFLMFSGCGFASNPEESISYKNGDNGLVSVSKLEVKASLAPNSQLVINVPLENRTDKAIHVVAMKSDCSCTQAQLPIVVPPHSKSELLVRIASGNNQSKSTMDEKRIVVIHNESQGGLSIRLVLRY